MGTGGIYVSREELERLKEILVRLRTRVVSSGRSIHNLTAATVELYKTLQNAQHYIPERINTQMLHFVTAQRNAAETNAEAMEEIGYILGEFGDELVALFDIDV